MRDLSSNSNITQQGRAPQTFPQNQSETPQEIAPQSPAQEASEEEFLAAKRCGQSIQKTT